MKALTSSQATPEAFKRLAVVVGKPKPKKRVSASKEKH